MSNRVQVVMLNPAGGTPGQVPVVSPDGTIVGWGDPLVDATSLVPWTSTAAGIPVFLWDDDDNLMMIEES